MQSRVVVAAVIKKKKSFLFGRKKKDIGPYPNTWHLLGGGVEEGENFENAITREILEEAGIEIANLKKIGSSQDEEPNKHGELTHYIFHIFSCDYKSGELKPGDDIVELKWFSQSELKTIPLTRPSIKFFKQQGLIE